MPVSKPSKKEETFINGKKSDLNVRSGKSQGVLLRIPQDFLDRIDSDIANRPIKISRNTWILEAIHKSF